MKNVISLTCRLRKVCWIPGTNTDYPLIDIIIFALNTGMRRGEMAGLMWENIDFSNKIIEVRQTRDQNGLRETTKRGLRRYVPMNKCVEMLLSKMHRKKLSKFVFLNNNGQVFNVHHIYRDFHTM